MATTERVKFSTVQEGRWAVRNALSGGYKTLRRAGVLPEKNPERYSYTGDPNAPRFTPGTPLADALNASRTVRTILKGVEGLSQDEQVARLSESADVIAEVKGLLTAAAGSEKDSERKELIKAARDQAGEAKKANTATKNLAASRDFAAHQAEKGKSVSDTTDVELPDEDEFDSTNDDNDYEG
jgi:hypothetical protein